MPYVIIDKKTGDCVPGVKTFDSYEMASEAISDADHPEHYEIAEVVSSKPMISNVKEMPTQGQFVATWIKDGNLCSVVYEWVNYEDNEPSELFEKIGDEFEPTGIIAWGTDAAKAFEGSDFIQFSVISE